ncbi:hypothetical protein P4655_23205 [Priestia megaterium]|uniref:hypothetical protein n=1 Tax=Priestia megaterium TaxID=1404 RepID=UPI0030C9C80B
MGNYKKQDRKHPELDINELFKRIKFESKRIQKSLRDIEGLLKRSQGLMQRLQITSNNGLANGNTFFNVAEAPAAPTPPTPQAPFTLSTGIQQVLINILSTAREIQRVRRQFRNTLETLIFGGLLVRRAGILRLGFKRAEEIELGVLVLMSQLENLSLQLEELQENLDINIALLNTLLNA